MVQRVRHFVEIHPLFVTIPKDLLSERPARGLFDLKVLNLAAAEAKLLQLESVKALIVGKQRVQILTDLWYAEDFVVHDADQRTPPN